MEKLKVVLLLSLAFLFCSQTNAQTVSVVDAKAKALEFFSNGAKKLPARNGAKRQAPAVSNVELAYTSQKEGKTCFYVFNNGTDGGFVIVGGDEAAKEILAYVPQGHFEYDEKNMPENLKSWLSFYADEIGFIKTNQVLNSSIIPDDSYITYKKVDIPDLLTTKWNQTWPYNAAIPSNISEPQRPVTGCSATAIAQIMNYWKYPQSGIGSKSYSDLYGHNLYADFEHTMYDWDNMLDSYEENATQAQIDAVSTLNYHVGVALGTNYSYYGSSTKFPHTALYSDGPDAPALVETFGYDSNILEVSREHYSIKEWERLIYDELIEGRPVLYVSCPDTLAGHEFIIHGYDANTNMFSINWGWGGIDDGYYSLSTINANLQYYIDKECLQFAYLGIQPPGRERNIVERGDRFESNGMFFKIVSPTHKTVELSYYEEYWGSEYQSSDPIEIPSTVYYLGEEYTVDRLGKGALKDRSTLHHEDFGKYTEFDAYYWTASDKVTKLPKYLRSLGEEAFSRIYVDSVDLSNISHISSDVFNDAFIKHIDWPSAVTKIPTHCFQANDVLESITIPEGVLKIDQGAFHNCKNLNNVNLPHSLTFIGFDAFHNCSNFTRVEIPESVSFVGMSAFEGCNKLFEFICHSPEPPMNGLRASSALFVGIAPNTDIGTLYVPLGSISLYQNAENWKDWKKIEAIENIPQTSHTGETFTVDGIEYQILADRVVANGLAEDIHDLYIPTQVEHEGITYPVDGIADWAFEHCDIHSINIENGCRYIGHGSFSQCPLGGNIDIPSSVQEIREMAFGDYRGYVSDLTHLTLHEGLKFIGSDAFKASIMGKIVIPSSVEVLESGLFSWSTINTIVVKGGNIKWVDRFCGSADSLKHVVLPEDFWNKSSFFAFGLGGEFPNCKNLEDIVLYYCPKSLDELTTRFRYPPFMFDDFSKCILYVPETSVEIYKSSPDWNRFKDILPIVPLVNIGFEENGFTLESGQTKSLNPTFSPINTTVTHCTWTSSDPTIASVNQDGVVTAHKAGTATITATGMYYPEISSSCSVTVTAALPKGDVNGDGVIDIADVNCIINVILEKAPASNFNGLADVNGDGTIDIADINTVIAKILGN